LSLKNRALQVNDVDNPLKKTARAYWH